MSACRQAFIAFLKMAKWAYSIFRYHVFSYNDMDYKVIVLNELVPGTSILESHNYFYKTLFNEIDLAANSIGFVCSSSMDSNADRNRVLRLGQNLPPFLMDNITFTNLVKSLFINLYLILITFTFAFRKSPCSVGNNLSYVFWKFYLSHELGRVPCINEICCYWALKRFLKKSQCKLVVYPYEEKGLERSILLACRERNILSIGYTPHPQHRLALALRNSFDPISPKPSSYAVCGTAYVDYLVAWGKKDRNTIKVWGTGKSYNGSFATSEFKRTDLSVLVLISHPNELKIFGSWLRSEKKIVNSTRYLIRVWQAGASKFNQTLSNLTREFDCVQISQGSLDEDLKQCDVAIFCATSAGPLAIDKGYLAIYADLNDFFPINPCFDDLQDMLPCRSPSELAHRLTEISGMSAESLLELHRRQKMVAERIFSPVQPFTLRESLLC